MNDERDNLDQDRWLDELLRSPLRAERESPPGALVAAIDREIARARRRRRLIACGLAAAATVLVAVGWSLMLNRQALHSAVAEGRSVAVTQPDDALVPEPPRATFIGGPDVIVVPVESRHPNVTIVRVYPVYQPNQFTHTNTGESESLDGSPWPDHFNGG